MLNLANREREWSWAARVSANPMQCKNAENVNARVKNPDPSVPSNPGHDTRQMKSIMSMSRFRLNESPLYGLIPDPKPNPKPERKAVAMQSRDDVAVMKRCRQFRSCIVYVCFKTPCKGQPMSCPECCCLKIFLDPLLIQPADLVECLPQLACLVDVNLAGLLGVGLSELLANSISFNSLDEDSSL